MKGARLSFHVAWRDTMAPENGLGLGMLLLVLMALMDNWPFDDEIVGGCAENSQRPDSTKTARLCTSGLRPNSLSPLTLRTLARTE
jgi:hypothetical protein